MCACVCVLNRLLFMIFIFIFPLNSCSKKLIKILAIVRQSAIFEQVGFIRTGGGRRGDMVYIDTLQIWL